MHACAKVATNTATLAQSVHGVHSQTNAVLIFHRLSDVFGIVVFQEIVNTPILLSSLYQDKS